MRRLSSAKHLVACTLASLAGVAMVYAGLHLVMVSPDEPSWVIAVPFAASVVPVFLVYALLERFWGSEDVVGAQKADTVVHMEPKPSSAEVPARRHEGERIDPTFA